MRHSTVFGLMSSCSAIWLFVKPPNLDNTKDIPERLWQGEHDFLNLHRRVLGGLQGHCSQRSGAVEYLPPPPMLTIPAETDVKGDLQQECPGVTDVQIRLDRCHS